MGRLLTDALAARDLPWSPGAAGGNMWIPQTGVPKSAVVEAFAARLPATLTSINQERRCSPA
ncbi:MULTISPECIES: hypothetical protein [Nocardiopsis]|nr:MULTISPECIES: hypothetical protein [Nocardiopsis]